MKPTGSKEPMKQDQSTVMSVNVVNRLGQWKSVAATFPLHVAADILSGILEGTRQSLNEAFPARLEPPGSIIYYIYYRAFFLFWLALCHCVDGMDSRSKGVGDLAMTRRISQHF